MPISFQHGHPPFSVYHNNDMEVRTWPGISPLLHFMPCPCVFWIRSSNKCIKYELLSRLPRSVVLQDKFEKSSIFRPVLLYMYTRPEVLYTSATPNEFYAVRFSLFPSRTGNMYIKLYSETTSSFQVGLLILLLWKSLLLAAYKSFSYELREISSRN